MKQILLIRHGKVDIDDTLKLDAQRLKKWVEMYDKAPIASDSLPEDKTVMAAKDADVVVTSTLRRTIDSAALLGVEIKYKSMLFNEVSIPEVNLPWLKLKAKTWLVLLRLMMLFGFGKKDTSLKISKLKAKKAAAYLNRLSKADEKVALVGHGGMNWLIGKALVKKGWKLEGKVSHENWAVTVLQKN